MWATLPGTGNAGAVTCLADPVASSSSVEPSQRAERSGSQRNLRLKVRANPQGNLALVNRPDRPKHKGVSTTDTGGRFKSNCIAKLFFNDIFDLDG